jgi:hypothetical protein
MSVILQLLGAVCLIGAPLLIVGSFVLVWRLGRLMASTNPDLWAQMKPGLYSDIRISRAHRQRLDAFVSTAEYRELNNTSITRLAIAYRIVRLAAVVAMLGALVTVFWAMKT